MKAEIISVGTELLLGSILNTNQQYLTGKCALLGIDVFRVSTVGDNPGRIAAEITDALHRADLVITTGGLGPTADDVTLQAAASALGWRLVRHGPTYRAIERILRHKRSRVTPAVARQADVPDGAAVFPNAYGTAPGILAGAGPGKRVLLLPGPPKELIPMFEELIAPFLARRCAPVRGVFITRALRFSAIPEAAIAERMDDLLKKGPPVTMGIYARPGEVELRIMSKGRTRASAEAGVAAVEREVRRRMRGEVILAGDETLEELLGRSLRASGMTLAAAESCTGGLVGHLITNVPGSSDYFRGGVVAYDNRVKTDELGVPPEMLRVHGAVSSEVAERMAGGIRARMGTDLGLGLTGIAGPSGARSGKPVGLVYIALSDARGTRSRRYHFIGKREDVKAKAAKAALVLLLKSLRSGGQAHGRLEEHVCV